MTVFWSETRVFLFWVCRKTKRMQNGTRELPCGHACNLPHPKGWDRMIPGSLRGAVLVTGRGSHHSLPHSQWHRALLPKDWYPEDEVTPSTLTSTLTLIWLALAWHLSPTGSGKGKAKVRISYWAALSTFYKTARIPLNVFLSQGDPLAHLCPSESL